jgi:NarL family two-component system sensor histidine kinase LiaS
LAEAEQLVRQAQQELTTLIQELRPAALESKGLATALRDYVADWSRQSNISVEVRVQGERSLPLVVEQTLFRVAQEALANVARHGEAATARVYLVWDGNGVTLTVSDDGQGFNMAAMNGKGMGLQSMRERVEALGGRLAVDSKPKVGTEVTAQLANVA